MVLIRLTLSALLASLLSTAAAAQSLPRPQVVTQPAGSNSSFAASTAYVDRSAALLQLALSGKAPLMSPAFMGQATFSARPSFAGATPWDSGNLNPSTLAPIANPQFSGAVKADTLQILGPGSTGDGSGFDVRPDGAVVARALRTRLNDAGISVLDYGANVGTGGDDSAAINAAINAAIAGKSNVVLFPQTASGFYNVCADAVRIANDSKPINLVLRGVGSGGQTIRVLPGCNTPAVQTSTVFVETGYSTQQKSGNRLLIDNLRIDGYCISQFPLNISFSVSATVRNSVIRNAKPGAGSATVRIGGGYEHDIDQSVLIENAEDPGHQCYGTANNLPDYNLWTSSTDSKFSPVMINARLAGAYQDKGGNNDWSKAHVWGYPPINEYNNPDFRPQYGYIFEGRFKAVGATADSPRLSGFWIKNTIGDDGGGVLVGSGLVGQIATGASGVKIDPAARNTIVTGNNFVSVPNSPGASIDVGTGLHGSNIVARNIGANIESNITIKSIVGGDSLAIYSNALGSGANIEAASPNGSANLRIMGQGDGAVILGTRGLPAFSLYSDPGAANFIQAHGVGPGGWPEVLAVGSDANIPLWLRGKGTAGILQNMFIRNVFPTVNEIPAGSCADWNNTTAGTMQRVCNVGGTLKALAYN